MVAVTGEHDDITPLPPPTTPHFQSFLVIFLLGYFLHFYKEMEGI